MIVGIGTDLVAIERLEGRLASVPALAGRLFTPRERAACAGRAACLAGRFAAKEAVLKALGSARAEAGRPAPEGWRYTDIEVVSAPGLLELAGRVGREGESWRRARASDRRASSLDA